MKTSEGELFTAAPLLSHLGTERGKRSQFARWLNVSPQVVTNWLRRNGIPAKRLIAVCALMDVTVEQYIKLSAGEPIDEQARPSKLASGCSARGIVTVTHTDEPDEPAFRVEALRLAVQTLGTPADYERVLRAAEAYAAFILGAK